MKYYIFHSSMTADGKIIDHSGLRIKIKGGGEETEGGITEKFEKFVEQEQYICNSVDKKLLAATLIGFENGKVAIIKEVCHENCQRRVV